MLADAGREAPAGESGRQGGELVRHVRGDADPVFSLGYWRNEKATRAKYAGDW